jgi:hypothetical protein
VIGSLFFSVAILLFIRVELFDPEMTHITSHRIAIAEIGAKFCFECNVMDSVSIPALSLRQRVNVVFTISTPTGNVALTWRSVGVTPDLVGRCLGPPTEADEAG